MFTYLGKLLVLLNAFAAVAVLAWAASAFVTRFDPNEAVDASGVKLTDKVKKANTAAAAAQVGYAPELARVGAAEARLEALRLKIDARLKQADESKFYNIYDSTGAAKPDPDNPDALDRVERLVWDSPADREIKGLNGKSLRGVGVISKELADERAAASASIEAMEASVKNLNALNAEVVALNDRFAWLEGIGKRHDTEIATLVDLRVNWENRSGSLLRRRTQLIGRLDDLKVAPMKVGAAPAVPGPSALTLTPLK